jgi:hypothetical protein
MKTKFFSFLVGTILMNFSVFSQKIQQGDLPPGLVFEFGNRYPAVENVNWQIVDETYKAEFEFMENSVTAIYDLSTRWLKSETVLKYDDLPRTIIRYINSNHPSFTIEDAIYIEKREEIPYYKVKATENEELRLFYFDKDGVFQRLTDTKGNFLLSGAISTDEPKKSISPKELPSSIGSYISMNHANFRISESYVINDDEYSNAYHVVLASNLHKDDILLWFDFTGSLLHKEDPYEGVQSTNEQTSERRRKREEEKIYPQNLVPQNVVTAFNKQVRRHEELVWDTLQGNFVANYIEPVRKEKSMAVFTPEGKWLYTQVELDVRSLNQNINRHIENHYPDLSIHSAHSFNTWERKRYVLVKLYSNRWVNDPMVYHELYFSTSGRLENEIYANYKERADVIESSNNTEDFLNQVNVEELKITQEHVKISTRELPSRALNHNRKTYPDHRIHECYRTVDEVTEEIVYWIILRQEGVRIRIKAIYDFKGNFIEDEEI